MKILRRAEFMAMPSGTLYVQASEPWAWGDINIKWDTLPCPGTSSGGDWVYQDLQSIPANDSGEMFGRFDEMLEAGASYPLELDCAGRDGCFDVDAIFLVYERDDLIRLRDKLNELIDL